MPVASHIQEVLLEQIVEYVYNVSCLLKNPFHFARVRQNVAFHVAFRVYFCIRVLSFFFCFCMNRKFEVHYSLYIAVLS